MLKFVQVVVECDCYSLRVNVGTVCSGSWCVDSYSLRVNVETCAGGGGM